MGVASVLLSAHDAEPYSAIQKCKDKKKDDRKRRKNNSPTEAESGDIYGWLKNSVRVLHLFQRTYCFASCQVSSRFFTFPSISVYPEVVLPRCFFFQNKFRATVRTQGVSTTDIIVRILQNYEDYVDRCVCAA